MKTGTVRAVRAIFFGVLAASAAACSQEALDVPCPEGTVDMGGTCSVACAGDDQCTVSEICDLTLGACVRAEGTKPVITELRAELNPIARGTRAHLFYGADNAASVDIAPGTLAPTNLTHGDVWTPALNDNTELVFTARGAGGRVMRSIIITLVDQPGPPQILSFTATPNPVPAGGFATLAWNVTGADTIQINKADGTPVHADHVAQGNVAYFPAERTNLVLIASNASGSNEAQLTVDTESLGPGVDAFQASDSAVIPGANVLLTWSTHGANAVSVLDETGNAIFTESDPGAAAQGRLLVPMPFPDAPASGQVSFGLVASDGTNTASADMITIHVVAAPSIASFDVNPEMFFASMVAGIDLDWQTAGASSIDLLVNGASINGAGWPASGHTSIGVPSSSTIQLTATNLAGTAHLDRRVWELADERENNDSEQTAEPIGRFAVRNRCRSDVFDQNDWFLLDAGGGGSVRVSIGDGSGGCPDTALGTVLELHRDGVLLGTTSWTDANTCPAIDPRVHDFARDLPAGGPILLHVSQSGLAGCGAYMLTAEVLARSCGNGLLEQGEACDDGNAIHGDGCSASCTVEAGSAYDVSAPMPAPFEKVQGDSFSFTSYDARYPAEDEGVALLELPFSFTFFGRSYDQVRVYTDGYISFGDFVPMTASGDNPQAIPSASPTNALVALVWSDLLIDHGTRNGPSRVVHAVVGAAPHRRLVIDYQNLRSYDSLDLDFARVNAQIVLEEGSNAIELRYGDQQRVGTRDVVLFSGIENHQGSFGYPTAGCERGCSLDAGTLPENQMVRMVPR